MCNSFNTSCFSTRCIPTIHIITGLSSILAASLDNTLSHNPFFIGREVLLKALYKQLVGIKIPVLATWDIRSQKMTYFHEWMSQVASTEAVASRIGRIQFSPAHPLSLQKRKPERIISAFEQATKNTISNGRNFLPTLFVKLIHREFGFIVQRNSSLAGKGVSENLMLSNEMLILHFIATGIIKRANRIEQGEEVKGDYEIPLQLGLDRLNVLRYTQNLPLIKSVPDLLSWCQKPFFQWLPENLATLDIDSADQLLNEAFPSELCHQLACLVGDIEAELSERRFIEQVFAICEGASDPQAYTDLRRLLITTPVMTALELLQCCQRPSLEILRELLPEAYEHAPLDYLVNGKFYCCPTCHNLLQPNYEQTRFFCENERCRRLAAKSSQGRVLAVQDQVYWLKRGQRRFIAQPGLAELRLEESLLKMGVKVEMWPEFDSYDLQVKLPRKTIAVDVKDWVNPFLLAHKVQEKEFPISPVWDEAYYVFPKERKAEQPDYVRAFSNTYNGFNRRVKIGGKIKAVFENGFLKMVRKELEEK